MEVISVVLPVFNGEETIKETVNSVLNQTFINWELIVINDGSQDATLEIVSSIKDERIKVFSYQNKGQPASRNRGIARAKGEYISFIDADDLWTADKLEAQYQALRDNPQAAVAYSWTDWIDESGQLLSCGSYISENGDVFAQLLLQDFIANGSNPLIRRQALLNVGNFDESLSNAHDWDMWLRLAAHYPFVVVPSAQILYRKSTSSMSANVWGMEASSLRVIEKALAQAPESIQQLKRSILANRYKYLTYKAVEWPLERKRGLAAMKFLVTSIQYDPVMLRRFKLISILLFKIAVAIGLPDQVVQRRIAKLKLLNKK